MWSAAQRADLQLFPQFAKLKPGFRIGEEGVLEKQVEGQQDGQVHWLPVVPAGHVAVNLTWKFWVFLQLHVGVFGMHRPVEKTLNLMRRMVWWDGMKGDVDYWTDRCLTCIRFRKRPTKQDMVPVKPIDVDCWEEVMVDCEGSSRPMDAAGHCYVLTYLLSLIHI